MLAPELADVCEVLNGSVSTDVIIVSAIGASAIVEVFEPNDVEGSVVEVCTDGGSNGRLELDGCEALWVFVFVVAVMISLRLQLPAW